MAGEIHIPRGYMEDTDPAPSWIALQDSDGNQIKPAIRCQCGMLTCIGLHHVHADGRVTASFLHDIPQPEACGWHEFLILDGWFGFEFLPERDGK
ncbi:MAG: hypothetical protein ACR2LC_09610 [Pyrinomonadaceae bacterium]